MVNLCGVSFNNIAIFTLNLKLKLKILMLLLGFCKCRDFKKWTSLSPIMSLLLFLFFFQITPTHSQTHQDIISIDRHYISNAYEDSMMHLHCQFNLLHNKQLTVKPNALLGCETQSLFHLQTFFNPNSWFWTNLCMAMTPTVIQVRLHEINIHFLPHILHNNQF